jgi:hypothetical protein
MYYETKTNIDNVLTEFSDLHKKLQFTLGKEVKNRTNYLDVTIYRKPAKFTFSIYHKPTTTSTIIHRTSYHPTEHKAAVFNFLYNRVNQYAISGHHKQKEMVLSNKLQ